MQSTLIADLSAGDDLILSSVTNAVDSRGMLILVADHSMAVYGWDAKTQMFEVYNPWGAQNGQYWDTTFEVSLATLLSNGDTISVAANRPASGSPGLMAAGASPLTGMTGAAGLTSLGLAAIG